MIVRQREQERWRAIPLRTQSCLKGGSLSFPHTHTACARSSAIQVKDRINFHSIVLLHRLQVARHGKPQRVPVLVGAVAGVHSSLEGELPHFHLVGDGSKKNKARENTERVVFREASRVVALL